MRAFAERRPVARAMVATAVFSLAVSAHAQGMGLLDVYALAALNDPAFRAAQATHAAGQESRALGRAGLLPQLGLSYQRVPTNRQQVFVKTPDGREDEVQRDYSSYAATLTLTQPLFDAAAWARWKQSGAYMLMSDEQFRAKAQDLALRSARTYTDLLYAQDQLGLAQAQVQTYAQQLLRNRHAFEAGEGTRTDIADTEARLALAEVTLIDARGAVEGAQRALRSITGVAQSDLRAPLRLRPDFADKLAPHLPTEPLVQWENRAMASNPDLAAQRHSLDVSQQEINRQRAGHLPTVRLFVQYAQNRSEIAATYDQRYRTTSAGLLVNVPLYAGGSVSAATRQAAHQAVSAGATLEARTQEVLLELRRQHQLSDSGPARIAASLKAVRAAEIAVEGSRRGVAAGERANLDVLNATQLLFSARRDLARASYETLNARLGLRYQAGELGEGDLRDVAAMFLPAENARSAADGPAQFSSDSSTVPPTVLSTHQKEETRK